jgi:hypothetical protein
MRTRGWVQGVFVRIMDRKWWLTDVREEKEGRLKVKFNA